MSRFIMISLLLLVCFFGGISYGSFEQDRQINVPEIEEEHLEVAKVIEPTTIDPEPITHLEEEDVLVHKTATFFEKMVSGMYELIINILYQIANLFFD
ncbi:hypothetical protein SPD48_14260 [Pseudogracilibacillus sp. SE30717A]|uniref:hypothetical protein n=1 Tax=Pseudogracilibacillus sp. SE30717A TaxID=3098293 RepID=UPI00300E5885